MSKESIKSDNVELKEALDLYYDSLGLTKAVIVDLKQRILNALKNRRESSVDIALSDCYLTVNREGEDWYLNRNLLNMAIEHTRRVRQEDEQV